jgi:hypothetical protein
VDESWELWHFASAKFSGVTEKKMQESAFDSAERAKRRRFLSEILLIDIKRFAATDIGGLSRLNDTQLMVVASTVIDECVEIELLPVPDDWQPQTSNPEGLIRKRSTYSGAATALPRSRTLWNLTSIVVEAAQAASETAIGVYDDLKGHWVAAYTVLSAFCAILHAPTRGFDRNEALTFIGLWTKWIAGGTRFTTEDGYTAVAKYAKDAGWGEVDGSSYQMALMKLAIIRCINIDSDLVSFPETVAKINGKSGH